MSDIFISKNQVSKMSTLREFKCSYDGCDKEYKLKGNLKQHIKAVHDKIKDFECDKCEFKCSANSHLKTHIKMVHDKIKDIECDKCDYKCSSNSDLKKHIKTCTGESNLSSGEFKVRQYLDEMKIKYEHNTSYIVKDINLLKWDFILYEGDEVKGFIEYDGRQHFKPVRFGNMTQELAEENLITSKRRDKIKNDFCEENHYPLLRIKYDQFGNIPAILTEFAVEHLDWGCE